MDSPAVKRQKTAGGYTAANNNGYNSDVDDGDQIFDGYIPDTPKAKWETQPTQILEGGLPLAPLMSSPPREKSIIQVPASSPFTGRDDLQRQATSAEASVNGSPMQKHSAYFPAAEPVTAAGKPLSSLMAPAGTAYKAPQGIRPAPPKTVISLDSEDDTTYQKLDSSDDEIDDGASIKPTTFAAKHPSDGDMSKSSFSSMVSSMKYQPTEHGGGSSFPRPLFSGNAQTRPDRARPVPDLALSGAVEASVRVKVDRLRAVFPTFTVPETRTILFSAKGSFEDAAAIMANGPAVEISDDENSKDPIQRSKKLELESEPQMKRVLNTPIASLIDKYSHTYRKSPASSTQQFSIAEPARPKKRLVQGRRNASPPSATVQQPPQRRSSTVVLSDDDSDSGIGSGEEVEDPLLQGRFLKWLNNCSSGDLIELTGITKEYADLMMAARPFRNIEAAENVEGPPLKSGKKRAQGPIGEKIVEKGLQMYSGYEAVDALVTKCEYLGKPLAEEMGKWGFDVFGAAKNGTGVGIVSLNEDEKEAQRDSGVGSPISASTSLNGDNGEDNIKASSAKRKSKDVTFLKQPAMMADDFELKDYQVVGLNWLALMYRQKLSCILADDMGLGKTCQVISFFTHLVESGKKGPHIVVLPGSVLENWLREFQKFSPNLVVEPYHGSQKDRADMAEKILEHRDEINVVVSTYELVVKKDDNKFMRRLKPDVAVFDEGHVLKNPLSLRFQGINKIPTNFRLLLTGTPLQNNLQELATLLSFILPEIFAEKEEDMSHIFKHKIQVRDTDHGALLSAQRIARARSMLTPFVLRRKKAQVLKHLPAKILRVQYCAVDAAQKEIYLGHTQEAKERAQARLTKAKIPKNENQENNPLMQLRKAAIHPMLFRRHFTNDKIEIMADILRERDPVNFNPAAKREHLINEMRGGSDFWLHNWCLDYPCIKKFDTPDMAWMKSGKVTALVDLVKGYKKNGDRVLIFSQFSLVLDILEAVLNTSLIHFTRIDGSTKIDERQTLIDNFRDDESITAFLLTTKAGGVGLNLAFANKVIIFDGSFNPQDDRQAENRAHRVGQTREVEVVRLVTRGTVEESIYNLGQSKLLLDGRVAGEEEFEAVDDEEGEAKGVEAVNRMLLDGIGANEADLMVVEEDAATKAEKKDNEADEKPDKKIRKRESASAAAKSKEAPANVRKDKKRKTRA
ncbi:SNF2 family helicase [Phlyctema vagabunda]|uniref:SNF2 family helicase n=1 Tax=Phlyctema vagabunda TaxID=108571 RepID=A0ABR4P6U1_9HELO